MLITTFECLPLTEEPPNDTVTSKSLKILIKSYTIDKPKSNIYTKSNLKISNFMY